ncbi:MAG: WXG100 family type VII secretion target [Mycobacteriales bacterium]
MATYEFPALGFDPAPGDPGQISAQATAIRNHSVTLSTYASQLDGLKTDGFEGDTADAFHDKLGKLPPDLHTSSDVYGKVANALDGFASTLAEAQRQARSLEEQAAAVKRRKDAAQGTVDQHNNPPQNETDAQKTQREQDLAAAKKNVSGLDTELQGYISRANTLHQHVLSEASRTAGTIRDLADAPPYKEPHHHWWDKVGDFFSGVGDWIKDHADLLKKISGILKMVSAVCGLLSFIPVVGPFFGAVALVTGGLALGIDVVLKLVTGQGSWLEIGLDAVMTFLPGGKVAKLLGRPLKALGRLAGRAPGLARLGKGIASGAKGFSTVAQKAVFQLSRLTPRTRAMESMAAKLNKLPMRTAGRWMARNGEHHASPTNKLLTDFEAGKPMSGDQLDAIRGTHVSRYSRNAAYQLEHNPDFARYQKYFDDSDMAAMAKGNCPHNTDPMYHYDAAMERSHEPIQLNEGGHDLVFRDRWQHQVLDPHRQPAAADYLNRTMLSGRFSNVGLAGTGAYDLATS